MFAIFSGQKEYKAKVSLAILMHNFSNTETPEFSTCHLPIVLAKEKLPMYNVKGVELVKKQAGLKQERGIRNYELGVLHPLYEMILLSSYVY